MKKNAMLKIAAILMVAVLLTTCAISSTFAKYTTSGNIAVQTAKVAKFGVEITGSVATDDALFAKAYKAGTDNDVAALDAAYNVVAPGTASADKAINFTVTGKPEVAVEITTTAAISLQKWEVNGEFYCPIVFNVNGTEIKQDATNSTAAKLESAIKNAIEATNGKYAPNTDLSEVEGLDLDIDWAWAFNGDDAKDTALGDAAADGNAATISISIERKVEQIDTYSAGN